MMIQSKRHNLPVWNDVYTHSKLPAKLSKLEDLSRNIWWVWSSEVRKIFADIDHERWEASQGNPIEVLNNLTSKQQDDLMADEVFMARVDKAYQNFQDYLAQPMRSDAPSVAYFSMEYGLSNILKIYSGGLGVLAGDYLKEASDSRVDMVGVGFLYKFGYFDQVIASDGQQVAQYKQNEFNKIPVTQVCSNNGTPMTLEVPFRDHVVYSYVWRVDVGRIPLYLMDTDHPQNSDWDKPITSQLYGGDWENRMKQEYLLGIGGIQMLKKLGIKKEVYHCNEGHAAIINIERIAELVAEGKDFDHALEIIRASSLYTVHTPVPAGHDYFDEGLFAKYMEHYAEKLGITFQELIDLGRENPGSHDKFSMSTLALNTAQEANGVSWLHGKVSQKMFAPVWKGYFPEELHVGYVTNGVHFPSWTAVEWIPFYKKYISDNILEDQANVRVLTKIESVPDSEIWEMRKEMKARLIRHLRASYQASLAKENNDPTFTLDILDALDPDALLIGFGRRFATYKRAHLLFTDLERLAEIVNNKERPVQFIYTGKAHPADGGGQGLIKRIIEISRMPQFQGKVLFLENYDIRVARRLIAGVDVWLNTPTRPLEASGTSGMKALMNGVLNFSVLDGWWYEGYIPAGGWAITDKRTYTDQGLQDKLDAVTIYKTLEEEIIPLYYDRSEHKEFSTGWVQMIKTSMSRILPHFTMRRMINDYIERFYRPLAERSKALAKDNYSAIDQLVEWKRGVARDWDKLETIEVKSSKDLSNRNFEVGEQFSSTIVLDMHELNTALKVELVVIEVDANTGETKHIANHEYKLISSEGTRRTYRLDKEIDNPGNQKLAIRIAPTHELLAHPMDFAYVSWLSLF
ncbi:alpha-glucan family phosphorylase [Porphyromonas levii]|uniref:alpha-glucan family phosphorylase n=1 Tax=Porphyromonas levii TaxID=28114 RepID=UPI001BAD8B07